MACQSSSSAPGIERTERDVDHDRRDLDLHGVQRAGQGRPGRLALRDPAVHVRRVLPARTQQRAGGVQFGGQLPRLLRFPATLSTPVGGGRLLSGRRGCRRTFENTSWVNTAATGEHDWYCG